MTEPNRTELIKEIDTLLIRIGKNYDNASHPALLITSHRDEILSLFTQEAEAIRKEERERILKKLELILGEPKRSVYDDPGFIFYYEVSSDDIQALKSKEK
jgi:hypothetical protein